MRWPWTRKPPLVVEVDAGGDDAAEAAEALRRAREALRKAQTDSETMRRVTGSIHRERQRDNFSGAFYDAMRNKEA